jgi:hypothetical protein
MPESSNAEKSKSLKYFGRKSDFSAEHPEKAFEPIFSREEDREISIDDNLTQFEKEPQPITSTESGRENFVKDTQNEKAKVGISRSSQPCSKAKVARPEQLRKYEPLILVVTPGRTNNFSDEQSRNAKSPTSSEDDRGRKTTSVRVEHERKLFRPTEITEGGIEIDRIDVLSKAPEPMDVTGTPFSPKRIFPGRMISVPERKLRRTAEFPVTRNSQLSVKTKSGSDRGV